MRWHLMMTSPRTARHRQMLMQTPVPPLSRLAQGSLARQLLTALEPQPDTHGVMLTTPLSVRTLGQALE